MEHTHTSLREQYQAEGKLSNIYTTCDEIPLNLFIQVYFGNYKALIKDKSVLSDCAVLEFISKEMIVEYIEIIQSKNLNFEIESQNTIINLQSKIYCLEVARNCICSKEYQDGIDILRILGYKNVAPGCESDKIINDINSDIATLKVKLGIILRQTQTKTITGSNPDKSYFSREMATVCRHYKMMFNPCDCTAAIYANLVKEMINDLKHIQDGK